MYIPRPFRISELDPVAEVVERVGAGDLVTSAGGRLTATRLPVLWERAGDGYGRVLAHLARANPQGDAIEAEAAAGGDPAALLIVSAAQAYISPSAYPSAAAHGRMVPTWNYTAVHLSGPVRVHRDPEWLRDVVGRLSDRHERDRPVPWTLQDAPADYLQAQLAAIVGVELTVTDVQAARKLSQNRPVEDRRAVVADLNQRGDAQAAAVARDMDRALAEAAGEPERS
jgi:transcriptional regulator